MYLRFSSWGDQGLGLGFRVYIKTHAYFWKNHVMDARSLGLGDLELGDVGSKEVKRVEE